MPTWTKLKDIVSKKKKEKEKKEEKIQTQAKVVTGEKLEIKKDEIEKIVERLRRKSIESGEVRREVAAIRHGIERREIKRKLSFKTVRFDEKMNSLIYSLGRLYQSFEAPIIATAKWLSNFPLAKKLNSDLRAAGLNLTIEQYLIVSSTASIITAALSFFFFATIGITVSDIAISVLSLPMALFMFVFTAMITVTYPSRLASSRGDLVSKELPFALRQMATQVKAGISLHKSMVSVAESGYGALSEEFRIALDDMQRGTSTDQALLNMANRTRSKGLKKTIVHMLRAMRTGGNLSQIISGIADDVSFEMRMKIRDFTEKLNLIGIVYVMAGIIAPVVTSIIAAVMQIPMFGGGIPFEFVVVAYIGIIFVLVGIVWFTKKLEPKV